MSVLKSKLCEDTHERFEQLVCENTHERFQQQSV